jgi:hypothetical protein
LELLLTLETLKRVIDWSYVDAQYTLDNTELNAETKKSRIEGIYDRLTQDLVFHLGIMMLEVKQYPFNMVNMKGVATNTRIAKETLEKTQEIERRLNDILSIENHKLQNVQAQAQPRQGYVGLEQSYIPQFPPQPNAAKV